jgi:hypothetical protein
MLGLRTEPVAVDRRSRCAHRRAGPTANLVSAEHQAHPHEAPRCFCEITSAFRRDRPLPHAPRAAERAGSHIYLCRQPWNSRGSTGVCTASHARERSHPIPVFMRVPAARPAVRMAPLPCPRPPIPSVHAGFEDTRSRSGPGRAPSSLQIGMFWADEVSTGVCTASHESHVLHACASERRRALVDRSRTRSTTPEAVETQGGRVTDCSGMSLEREVPGAVQSAHLHLNGTRESRMPRLGAQSP